MAGEVKTGQLANGAATSAKCGTDISASNLGADSVGGAASSVSHLYGDGSDGVGTIAAPTTLSSDMYYSALTVDAGQTLNTAGYRVFVTGLATINGSIHNNGVNGTIPTAGTAKADAVLGGSQAGGAGGAAGAPGSNIGAWANSFGGAGGAGGTGAAGVFGGTVAGKTAPSAARGLIRDAVTAIRGLLSGGGTTVLPVGGQGGSGGGGGTGGSGIQGGGGGSGGGVVMLAARKIVVGAAGAITSNGGAGSAGAAGGGNAGGGGGGGGGGGLVLLVYNTLTNAGSIAAAGGALGAAGTGTPAGSAGAVGAAGTVVQISA